MTVSDAANLIVSQIWLGVAVITQSGWALAAGILWTVAYMVQLAARKMTEAIDR